MENTKLLLIAQMKRAIELLEQPKIERPFKKEKWVSVNHDHTELKTKLREIRRDSVRFIKECNKK